MERSRPEPNRIYFKTREVQEEVQGVLGESAGGLNQSNYSDI